MPTGYTNDVSNGKMTSLKDYALNCSRAFLVECRDSDNPIQLVKKPDTKYHDDRIIELKKYLKELPNLDYDKEAKKECDNMEKIWDNYYNSKLEAKKNYEAMLKKVKKWKIPKDLNNLKKFMISQLEDSINFDCKDITRPTSTLNTGKDWYNKKLKYYTEQLDYHIKERDKILDGNKNRNKFVKQIMGSLKNENR